MVELVIDDPEFMTIEELKKKEIWPAEWTATMGLCPYIRRLKGDVKGLELGTGRGESAAYILEKCDNVKSLTTIDPFKAYKDWNHFVTQDKQDKFEAIAEKNFKQFKKRVKLVKDYAENVITTFDNEEFDFIFIDGDHATDAVVRDLMNYYPKLRKGGICAVHDANLNIVRDGVRKFRADNRITAPIQNISNGVCFWYKA